MYFQIFYYSHLINKKKQVKSILVLYLTNISKLLFQCFLRSQPSSAQTLQWLLPHSEQKLKVFTVAPRPFMTQFLLLLFPSLLHPHSLPLILSAPATLTYLLLLQHSTCFSLQGFATALPLQIATCSVPPSGLHSSHLLRPSLTTMSGTTSPPFGTAYHSFPLNFYPQHFFSPPFLIYYKGLPWCFAQ